MCAELKPILPEVILSLGIAATMILSVTNKKSEITKFFAVLVLGLVIALKSMQFCCHGFSDAFSGSIRTSEYGALFGILVYLFAALSILAMDNSQTRISEKILLILFSSLGGGFLLISGNMITWYISLEILSLSAYALTAADLKNSFSAEAAVKYFFQGAFISVLILFGLALMYGLTGSLAFPNFDFSSVPNAELVKLISVGLLLCGMAFKIGLVPFHYWAGDVYQAASGGVSAFLASVVKVAAAGASFFIILNALDYFGAEASKLIWLLSFASILGGNLLALFQHNLKRMLAYSAVAHSGYFAIAFYSPELVANQSAFVFYLIVYALTTVLTFTFADLIRNSENSSQDITIENLKGLGRRYPLLATCFSFGLLTLVGLPPALAGLFGKVFLLLAAFNNGNTGLVVALVIGASISCYYYLKPIAYLFSADPNNAVTLQFNVVQKSLICLITLILLLISLCPVILLEMLEKIAV